MSAPGRTSPGFGRSGFSMGARFLLLAIVCIALMLLDRREQHLVRVRQALDVVVYPVRVAVDLPFSTWAKLSDTFAERDALIAENQQFRRERLETESRLQRLAALERENARLRELLDSTERVARRSIVAEILAVDPRLSAAARLEPRPRRRCVRRAGAHRCRGRGGAGRARGAVDLRSHAHHGRRIRRPRERQSQRLAHDCLRHGRQQPFASAASHE